MRNVSVVKNITIFLQLVMQRIVNDKEEIVNLYFHYSQFVNEL